MSDYKKPRPQKRRDKNNPSKDKKRSQIMKQVWKVRGSQIRKAIKDWHTSTKGRRFHRELGRFNKRRSESMTKAASVLSEYYISDNDELMVKARNIVDQLGISKNVQSMNVRKSKGVPRVNVVLKSPVRMDRFSDIGDAETEHDYTLASFKIFNTEDCMISVPNLDDKTVGSFTIIPR